VARALSSCYDPGLRLNDVLPVIVSMRSFNLGRKWLQLLKILVAAVGLERFGVLQIRNLLILRCPNYQANTRGRDKEKDNVTEDPLVASSPENAGLNGRHQTPREG